MKKKLALILEKGRRPDPLGTRKIQETVKPDGTKIRWWRKKTVQGWQYDGLVSEKEYKDFQLTQKRKTKTQKKVEETKKKVAQAKQDAKKQQQDDYKPTQAELDKMETKQKMYWTDQRVTKERRELADVTGILTLDDRAEKYVRDNMQTVFQMSDKQKNMVDGIDPRFPMDADGKALDDPVFREDSITALREMKSQLLSGSRQRQVLEDLREEWSNFSSSEKSAYNSNFNNFYERQKEEIGLYLDYYINALEQHENDRIVLGKLGALDRGTRFAQAIGELDAYLIPELFGKAPQNPWTGSDQTYKDVIEAFGITEKMWMERKWGAVEAVAFALSSVNDSYRNNVLLPFLDAAGNIVSKQKRYEISYGHHKEVQDFHYIDRAQDEIQVSQSLMEQSAIQARKKLKISQKTFEFLNTAFQYTGLENNAMTVHRELDNKMYQSQMAKNRLDDLERTGLIPENEFFKERRQFGVSHYDELPFANISYSKLTGSMGEKFNWGLVDSMTVRDVANQVKALSKRKEFRNISQQLLPAVSDLGKAVGNVSVRQMPQHLERKFRTLAYGLTPMASDAIKLPNSTDFARLTSDRRKQDRTHDVAIFYGAHTHEQYDPNNKKAEQSRIAYKNFRKSSKIYSTGRAPYTKMPYGNIDKGVKAAMRYKSVKLFATNSKPIVKKDDQFGNSVQYRNDHMDASIKMALSMNWQLRKLTKNDDVVPDFKWNPKLIPYGKQNKFTRSGEIRRTSYLTKQDNRGNTTGISPSDLSDFMDTQYKDSVAEVLGINRHKATSTSGTGRPQIVLKTSDQSTDDVQKRVDASWTHDKPGSSSHWQRGSMKVLNVFDVMYHDYFPTYKNLEQKRGNVKYSWHGTDYKAAANIIKNGYEIRNRAKAGRMLGDGIYFADSSSKSGGYLREAGWGRHNNRGVLLWNRITMGKTTDPVNYHAGIRSGDYDTIFAGGTTGSNPNTSFPAHDEYCVKNPKAAVPIQWVEVETR